jgi:hypothetical protein
MNRQASPLSAFNRGQAGSPKALSYTALWEVGIVSDPTLLSDVPTMCQRGI